MMIGSTRNGGLNRIVLLAAVVLIALLAGYLFGAGRSSAPVEPTAAAATATSAPALSLSGTRWLLTDWSVAELSLDGLTVDLEFVDGRLSGTSAVNVYNADYEAGADGSFRVGAVATTKMAGPEPAMRVETLYLTLLQAVGGYTLDDTTLTLLDADGKPSLIFTRQ